ncbi:MAG: glutamate--tRNA ligase, partial [Dehalococcoidia bacterium]
MVRVRYAPSPTGEPHVGNIRTALFNWLFARNQGGAFILRIEDTDQARIVDGALEAIFRSLQWLGLDYDEGPEVGGPHGPYVQSERLDHYREAAGRLVEAGHAYHCYCPPQRLDEVRKAQQRRKLPPRYDRHCRDPERREQAKREWGGQPVVRFQTPLSGQTAFHDLVRGDVVFDNETLDDFVLLKSDGFPTYHLANVVDDRLMAISHVLRGDEWLSSTPRHVLLYEALGWEPPLFVHLPMILGPDKAKLSKRHGDTSVLEYRDQGFLPEALSNFLALLGWSLDDRTEIIDRETLVSHFSLERILANPAVFNREKLEWMNGVYIRQLSVEGLADRLTPVLERALGTEIDRDYLLRIVPLIQERIKLLAEAEAMAGFFFAEGELDYPLADLLGKRFADAPVEAAAALQAVLARLRDLAPWDGSSLEGGVRPLAAELGLKT